MMKHIPDILKSFAVLEALMLYGLIGSYDIEQISEWKLIKYSAILIATMYITVRLIKVSAAVTGNNSRRRKMVKSHTINRFQHTTKSVICQVPHNSNENAVFRHF